MLPVFERILVPLGRQLPPVVRLYGVEVSYGAAGTYERLRATLAGRCFDEAATLNELDSDGGTIEADKLFVRRSVVG